MKVAQELCFLINGFRLVIFYDMVNHSKLFDLLFHIFYVQISNYSNLVIMKNMWRIKIKENLFENL